MNTNNHISQLFSELAQRFSELQLAAPNEVNNMPAVPPAEVSDIEVLTPEYLNSDYAAKLNLPTIYRFNQSGLRYYFTVRDQMALFFPSVTTTIQESMPTSPGLQKLRDDMGPERYFAFMRERAHYGTLLHSFAADYMRNNRYFDTDSIPQRIREYVEAENIRFDTKNWVYSLNKDLRAIVQFVHDYNVRPIAIELIGYYSGNIELNLTSTGAEGEPVTTNISIPVQFAGAIDLLCEMTIEEKGFFGEEYKTGEKKGQPKESKRDVDVIAVVDFKSGKNGFHPEHEMQLLMYGMMITQTFGIKIDKLFNVAPKDWESDTPTYSIKDQTNSEHAKRVPFLLGSYFCKYPGVRNILIMSGKLNGGNMSDCTKWVSASDWVLSKLGILKKEDPQELVEKAQKAISGIDKTLKNGNGKKTPAPLPNVMVEFGKALGVGFEDCTIVHTAELSPDAEIKLVNVAETAPKDELHEMAEQIKAKQQLTNIEDNY